MEFPTIGLILVTILFLVYLKFKDKKGQNSFGKQLKELPGPKGLPVVGNLFQVAGTSPNAQYCKWAKEFGSIFQVNLAGMKVVIVSDPKVAKDIFSDNAFSGRNDIGAFDMFPEDRKLGIFNTDGDYWEAHRRFLLRNLRDFGFGKSAMEQLIIDHVKDVIAKYKGMNGKPITNIWENLRLYLVNSLWGILTSKRLSYDDPKLTKVADNTTEQLNKAAAKGGILMLMPWLKYIIPGASGYNDLRAMLDANKTTFWEEVKEHKAAFKEEDLKDFIDVYIAEMQKTTDPNSPFYGIRAERNLVYTLFNLFVAGTETTASTISWTILCLSKFPEVQRKLQKEVDDVVGHSRTVSVADRPNMPYTMALIDEVLRFSSIAPDAIPHRVMMDTEFQGYFIPKDTWIQPNIYCIHMDPKTWGDPETFRPERFLSEDGKKYMRSENMQAFAVGKRACAGETLARDTVFLYVTNLFQQFNMEFDPNEKEPGLEGVPGFLRYPPPYHVLMKERAC